MPKFDRNHNSCCRGRCSRLRKREDTSSQSKAKQHSGPEWDMPNIPIHQTKPDHHEQQKKDPSNSRTESRGDDTSRCSDMGVAFAGGGGGEPLRMTNKSMLARHQLVGTLL